MIEFMDVERQGDWEVESLKEIVRFIEAEGLIDVERLREAARLIKVERLMIERYRARRLGFDNQLDGPMEKPRPEECYAYLN